jgi:hypothetical protein
LRVVLDPRILTLPTFPAENNASALIYERARAGLVEAWVRPAILEEFADVLGDHADASGISEKSIRGARTRVCG